jgi:hypothetical protein
MFTRKLGLAVVAMTLCVFGLQVGAAQKDKDSKDKKFEVPADALVGKVKAVDLKENSFTLTMRNGKPRSFSVTKETEFWGPKGGDRGTGPKGLSDDCMQPGYEVKVRTTKDGKTAKDVYLPNRKGEEK